MEVWITGDLPVVFAVPRRGRQEGIQPRIGLQNERLLMATLIILDDISL